MVAIVSRRTYSRIEMKYHDSKPEVALNDYEEHTQEIKYSAPLRQDDVQMSRPPLLSPLQQQMENERDHFQTGHTQAVAAAATPVVLSPAIANESIRSDTTCKKSPSFEHRDEQRSAFTSVRPSEGGTVPVSEEKQGPTPQHSRSPAHQYSRSPSQDHQAAMTRPIPVRNMVEEPLPFATPNHDHMHHEDAAHEGLVAAGSAEEAGIDAPYPNQHQYPQRYPPYQDQYPRHYQSQHPSPYHGYPPSNYHPPVADPDRNSSASMPINQYHPPYPGYHSQEYSTHNHHHHHQREYSNHYPYYPSTTHHNQQYPSHYNDPHHQHYYNPGATSPPASHVPDTSLKETPSAVKEITKDATTPSSARKPNSFQGEGLDLSPSSSFNKDIKPSAAASNKGTAKKDAASPRNHPPQENRDFEPIPLREIAAIPVLSSAQMQPPTPTFTAQEFPQPSPPPMSFADPFVVPHPHRVESPPASHADVSHAAAVVAPPRSTPVARRRHRTLLAPSSSGSTTSSTGEGGSWEKRYTELFAFRHVHGHCEVPQNYAENTSLGTWVNKQRMEQKNRTEGKSSSLNDSRLERLQSIGFRWAKRKGQASWDEKFNELEAYKDKVGNCHVPTKYKHNSALGRWVSTQRSEYKKYQEGQIRTSMNADKIRRLEGIGFAWFMAI